MALNMSLIQTEYYALMFKIINPDDDRNTIVTSSNEEEEVRMHKSSSKKDKVLKWMHKKNYA